MKVRAMHGFIFALGVFSLTSEAYAFQCNNSVLSLEDAKSNRYSGVQGGTINSINDLLYPQLNSIRSLSSVNMAGEKIACELIGAPVGSQSFGLLLDETLGRLPASQLNPNHKKAIGLSLALLSNALIDSARKTDSDSVAVFALESDIFLQDFLVAERQVGNSTYQNAQRIQEIVRERRLERYEREIDAADNAVQQFWDNGVIDDDHLYTLISALESDESKTLRALKRSRPHNIFYFFHDTNMPSSQLKAVDRQPRQVVSITEWSTYSRAGMALEGRSPDQHDSASSFTVECLFNPNNAPALSAGSVYDWDIKFVSYEDRRLTLECEPEK
jgi:hypothetical protein